MRIIEVECSTAVAEKLWTKHGVEPDEVAEVLLGETRTRRGREGLYHVLGCTYAGRYLFVVIRDLGGGVARVVTARDMEPHERREYRRR